jgi:hypothetical protein
MPSSLGESFGSAVAVTYVPALPTIGRIVARYQDQGNVKHASTSYLVGVKNGGYYIDLAIPKRSN